MNARLFDMLHHTADEDVGPVAHRIDIELKCIFEEAVDENRVLG